MCFEFRGKGCRVGGGVGGAGIHCYGILDTRSTQIARGSEQDRCVLRFGVGMLGWGGIDIVIESQALRLCRSLEEVNRVGLQFWGEVGERVSES